jgi:menaquinone-dependent protoporphyrinogen oxidase
MVSHQMKIQTRRRFIISGCKKLISIIGSASMGKAFSFYQTTNLPGEKNMQEKILVAYESQFGSTSEVAGFIVKILKENGSKVELKKFQDVKDLSSYKKVVIGSPIQYDTWMPEAKLFVESNKIALTKIPVAFFFTCLVLSKQTDDAKAQAEGYANKLFNLHQEVKPVSVGAFAGALDYSKMSFVFSIVARPLFALLGIKEGDYRNWNTIRSWTKSIRF